MTAELQTQETTIGFSNLGLPNSLIQAVETLGYKDPTPIQMQAIPALLSGSDVLGQAQTGTGKTAAFALPLLAKIDIKRCVPQILVLVPTRELADQVAKAFISFAQNMHGLNILAVYGGQGYSDQIRGLRKGAHIVIGTPGRIMDHMRRGALSLDGLKTLILDEADEMLRMGFVDDVEWVLEQTPAERQIGLFSATMPPAIKSITERYLRNPQKITVKTSTTTAPTIRQLYWQVSHINKLDALCRIIETEESDAIIIFVRTKRATEELSEQLVSRGFNAVPINGDIVQQQRERVIDQLKTGRTKILVATDVAARGIDVERITHVINYDVPHNAESYTHRIGRTGRAGRTGTAILFISPRDKYMLRDIERTTKQTIELMEPPSVQIINDRRIAKFKSSITAGLEQDVSFFEKMLQQYVEETDTPAIKVAACLAKLLQGDQEFLLKKSAAVDSASRSPSKFSDRGRSDSRDSRGRSEGRYEGRSEGRPARESTGDFREKYADKFSRGDRGDARRSSAPRSAEAGNGPRGKVVDFDMDQYRVDIGGDDGLQPKNLVGAIANTAGIEGRLIGKIKIEPKFAIVDLPKGMPKNVLQALKRLKISGKQMNFHLISRS